MTKEYEAQIEKYVEFVLEKGLLEIQAHILEHYEGDPFAQDVAMEVFYDLQHGA